MQKNDNSGGIHISTIANNTVEAFFCEKANVATA